ncbi:hypothetical protein [Aestuariibaculum sediminum]|uniref:Uncharacterized protein n=1 Tax=Aestuariibaculum sediminum TaxID=2770637 RepID=A0A8J6PYB9_9FLAO|nr:hypothetical protein [Aestuariibaculum sediminum]MBD0831007.1 hypothetical protein [Aestuariibaculum sediminum]
MSRLTVILFSFLILLQSIDINFNDLLKFDALIEHAQYHKQVHGDNFFQFIAEHYGNTAANHDDKPDEHKKLPFKEHHHVLCHLNSPLILTQQFSYNIKNTEVIESPVNFFYKESVSIFEKPSVFQPPKFA